MTSHDIAPLDQDSGSLDAVAATSERATSSVAFERPAPHPHPAATFPPLDDAPVESRAAAVPGRSGLRAPAIAEPLADGSGWRTTHLVLRRTRHPGELYLEVSYADHTLTVYLNASATAHLCNLARLPQIEAGQLWRALSEIPLDRPLPSRMLDEEFGVLLKTYQARVGDQGA